MGGKGAQAANATANVPASHVARRMRRGVQCKEYIDMGMDLLKRVVSGCLPSVSAYHWQASLNFLTRNKSNREIRPNGRRSAPANPVAAKDIAGPTISHTEAALSTA
jgi:hypothetical protein